jgi:hypothetical protein
VLILGQVLALATLVLLVYSLVDIIMSTEETPHGLPKLMWLVMVLILPLAGSIVWLVVSRRARAAARPSSPAPGPVRPSAPDPMSDDEYRRRIRERAEEQRRRAQEKRETGSTEPDGPEV